MSARTKEASAKINRIIKKHFLDYPGDWQYLAEVIGKQMNEPPMSVEAIQKRYRKVLQGISEGDEIRLGEDENLRKFKESLGFFEAQRSRAMEEERRATAMRDYKTYYDEGEKKLVILTDHTGHPIIDADASKARLGAIRSAYNRARDAQYHYDKLLLDTGNRVPKQEKDPDIHIHNMTIINVNIIIEGILRDIFNMCQRLKIPEVEQKDISMKIQKRMIEEGEK